MSGNRSQRSALLAKFKEHVARARYGSSTVGAYVAVAGLFLEYLSRRKVPLQGNSPTTALLDRRRSQTSTRW